MRSRRSGAVRKPHGSPIELRAAAELVKRAHRAGMTARAMRSESFVESASVEVLVRAGLDTAEALGEPMKHNHNGGKGQS